MATFVYNFAKAELLRGDIDLENDDIRIVPLMTNQTAVSQGPDAIDTYSDITTPDEFNGTNYSSGGLALDSQTVSVDDANDRAEFDSADETVNSLGAGTRAMDGVLLIQFLASLAASVPIAYLEFPSDKNPDGSNFTFAIAGLLRGT
jgi:hypothetical protein